MYVRVDSSHTSMILACSKNINETRLRNYPASSLKHVLDHKVYGQNWSRAFSRINGKSVDFLICTNDMKPLIAIELDDNTHDRPDRQKRDIFVNSIISDANMPLLRFKAGEWNSEIIKQEVARVLKESTLEKP